MGQGRCADEAGRGDTGRECSEREPALGISSMWARLSRGGDRRVRADNDILTYVWGRNQFNSTTVVIERTIIAASTASVAAETMRSQSAFTRISRCCLMLNEKENTYNTINSIYKLFISKGEK